MCHVTFLAKNAKRQALPNYMNVTDAEQDHPSVKTKGALQEEYISFTTSISSSDAYRDKIS